MVWFIVILPLIGAILNGLLLPRGQKTLSHWVGVAFVGSSFICSLFLFNEMLQGPKEGIIYYGFNWLEVGELKVPFELVVDRLSALMLLIVTGIGTLIHIYAGGYMHEEKTTYRFFSYLNLFVFMMLLLVLGNNLLVMFIGWEGVGLSGLKKMKTPSLAQKLSWSTESVILVFLLLSSSPIVFLVP